MTQLKKLNLKEKHFIANGKRYTILESIPMSRYIEYQKLVPRLTYGLTFTEIFKNLRTAYELQNTGKKYADVSVILHNLMHGINDIENENRHDAALEICALIIVSDDENIGTYDANLSKEKIKDWEMEGFEVNGFFHLALISIEGFRQTFLEYVSQEQAN